MHTPNAHSPPMTPKKTYAKVQKRRRRKKERKKNNVTTGFLILIPCVRFAK